MAFPAADDCACTAHQYVDHEGGHGLVLNRRRLFNEAFCSGSMRSSSRALAAIDVLYGMYGARGWMSSANRTARAPPPFIARTR